MQMQKPRWLVALALGIATIFDVTGAVVYRVLAASLPPAPPPPANGPFQQASEDLMAAYTEAVSHGRPGGEVTPVKDSASLPA